jgi:dihydrofolate synthase/folylpolyglutamate synthase
VIQTTAANQRVPCFSLGRDFDILEESPERFSYRGIRRAYEGLSCPLAGRHQLENAACALAALELAVDGGVRVEDGAIRNGLRDVRWPGRLELAGRKPDILLDGAHNPQAAEALAVHLTALHTKLILVVGMMCDKDIGGVLFHLAAVPGVSHMILTRAAHPRAAALEDLACAGTHLGIPIQIAPTVEEAFAHARALAGPDDTICVTGSLLVVGEAKAILDGTTVSPLRG